MARMVLKLPKLSVSMQEGLVTHWFVESGMSVEAGQPLYTVESDKNAFEVEAPLAGIVTPLVEAGSTYPVGTPVLELVFTRR